MTQSPNPAVTVTQADRELAHEIMHHIRGYTVKLPSDRHWLIDLIARHRQSNPVAAGVGEGLRVADKLDWRRVAKLAGEHGIRYRTNGALERFLAALSTSPEPARAALLLGGDAMRGEGL